jgi:hypothetical protein
MSADPNKKSPRTFQCRDVLWETFEQMARELECSVDYLVNEAMKQYAKQRSYGNASAQPPPARGTPYPSPTRGGVEAMAPPMAPQSAQNMYGGGGAGSVPPPPMRGGQPMAQAQSGRLPPPPARPGSLPAPPPPPRGGAQPFGPPSGRTAQLNPPMQMGGPPARTAPPSAPRSQPPPIPRGATPMPPIPGTTQSNGFPPQHGAQLSIIYSGDRMAVTKDRFVIGRGKQSSDLTLKDPNVSRQHAMIEYQNGVYFMVDMGSTNGVEYNGQRIARKQIAEGDVFRICDHDLRFTYR